ncbi:hypothetical protein WJ0W_003584 [Paenibacillus melissococcoides]|uniref:Uncharacterized protein n=1 Tax=Paenibacillus melissococcoides TaxID=2912268 RepID=A0ABN8U5X3_9BACL|nr:MULTISPECIES: hypothetical protein [Paenibacillus]MEB9897006.1 hypothetical protein [Bacillus cereus]CAH8246349.1 hypothetical protein WJ0W_003584 [Paenibacillus melissococcoides]CAH8714478.1 hypothetical protein HTL2_003956 [Paenibacillus melissococcoides]CAH8715434.1 hypothetical protein WDD9_004223 [Paenibacillus melissococcoides]GIO82661.1 hypothetical protein J6TS7_62710 [Paenibacillus dendritiformis]
MSRTAEGFIEDKRLLAMYKEGFSHVAGAVSQVECLKPETAQILVDAYSETNGRLLKQIRSERIALEAEIKQFLAQANSKLVYLVGLERHLSQLQEQLETIHHEAMENQETAPEEPSVTAIEGGEPS